MTPHRRSRDLWPQIRITGLITPTLLSKAEGFSVVGDLLVRMAFCAAERAWCIGWRVSGRRNSWTKSSATLLLTSGMLIDLKDGKRRTRRLVRSPLSAKDEYVVMTLLYGYI